ncbi:MAG: helix-turn-helix domain-containing protein [Bacteroidota bacterium]
MNYQTYSPHPDLAALVSCYWSLQVPKDEHPQRQRIIPDGTIEMAFILGDDIKRYTVGDAFILQPRAMVLGQTIDPFYIEPTGYVDTFAVRFFPFGFANFIEGSLDKLANKETAIQELFGQQAGGELARSIAVAKGVEERIKAVETFLLAKLKEASTIDKLVKTTVDTLLLSKGKASIKSIVEEGDAQRRQLERKFKRQVGISPKRLAKLIRLQAALELLLDQEPEQLTQVAYDCDYYDQAHFIKDFKEFTGLSPKAFLAHEEMLLSSVFYKPN